MAELTLFDRRRFLGGAVLLGGAAMLPGCAARTVAPAAAVAAPDWTALQALADRYVGEGKVAGMVIGIANGGSPRFLTAGKLGLQRDAKADADTIWRIYSMTKPVTGVLAAMMIDEGKLGLDQPIADFLPAYANMRVATNPETSLESTPARTPITVRHLLTHTAGLTYHFHGSAVSKAYRTHGLMPALRKLGREPGDGPHPASLQALATAAAKLPLVAEPGSQWHYSISIDVLGAVLEKAGGAPFDALLKARIFDPLGMNDTGFSVPASQMERFATNYFVQDASLVPIDIPPVTEYADNGPYPAPGGGLVSTAADYMKFAQAMANGGAYGGRQIVSQGAARLAVSNLLPPGVFYEGNQGYGAGGRVVIAPGGGVPGSFGWGGAAGTLASMTPGIGLAAVLMTQYMPQQAYPLPAEFAQAIMADLRA